MALKTGTTGAKKGVNAKMENISDIVAEIEDEGMARMHDIPVSEDGNVYDVPLLAGYVDPETGVHHTTFSYREMTGRDEEALGKTEIQANPGRILCTLVERCTIAIGSINKKDVTPQEWSKIIRRLTNGDLNFMVFKIRELSKGKIIEFTYKCRHCRKELHLEVSTDEFDVIPFVDFEKPFELTKGVVDRDGNVHKTGVIRCINGADLEMVTPMFKRNEASAMSLLLSRVIKMDDEGEGFHLTNRDVTNMTIGDRDYLKRMLEDLRFGISLNTEVVCDNCGEYQDAEVGSSDFL